MIIRVLLVLYVHDYVLLVLYVHDYVLLSSAVCT
jgi:hypothetical protein